MLALAHLKKGISEFGLFQFNHFAKVVEHRNMFWHLEKHAKTTANTRMQLKISTLLIYEVLIDNTLNRVAMFFRPSLLIDSKH